MTSFPRILFIVENLMLYTWNSPLPTSTQYHLFLSPNLKSKLKNCNKAYMKQCLDPLLTGMTVKRAGIQNIEHEPENTITQLLSAG